MITVGGSFEPSRLSGLTAQGRHDVALAAMLDLGTNGPAVGIDELLVLDVKVDGRDDVSLGLVLNMIYVVELVDANGLRVFLADSAGERDGVTSRFLTSSARLA